MLLARNIWFIVVGSELRTCDTSKIVLFYLKSLQFKVVNNFGKKLHYKICYRVLNRLGYFFRFTFSIDLFSSPNISTLHTNVCLTTGILQQCLSCRLDVLVNFGQIFALFLGTFIVDFENYLFIVNVSLWHIFVENQKGVIFMGVAAKH